MASWALASPSWALAAAMAPPAAMFRSMPMALSGLVIPLDAFSTRPMAVCRSMCLAAAMLAANCMSFITGALLPCEVMRLPTAASVCAFVYPKPSIAFEVLSICGLSASNDVPAALAEASRLTCAVSYFSAMSTAASPTPTATAPTPRSAAPPTFCIFSMPPEPDFSSLSISSFASPILAVNSLVFALR